MVVFRPNILIAVAVLILLTYACSPASYGLATGDSLGQAPCASGTWPDPSVVVLMASALVSTLLCKRVNRRIATGF